MPLIDVPKEQDAVGLRVLGRLGHIGASLKGSRDLVSGVIVVVGVIGYRCLQ